MDSHALGVGALGELWDFCLALCFAHSCTVSSSDAKQSLHVCGLREGSFAIWRILQ